MKDHLGNELELYDSVIYMPLMKHAIITQFYNKTVRISDHGGRKHIVYPESLLKIEYRENGSEHVTAPVDKSHTWIRYKGGKLKPV